MADQIIVERLRQLLSYDAETGRLVWRVARGPKKAGEQAGSLTAEGYLSIGIDGKTYQAHRIAWAIETGALPVGVLDHKNGARLDNRIANLRQVDVAANNANKHVAARRSVSGLLGTSWDAKNKNWRSEICRDGARKSLGRFATAQAAHAAYLDAKGKASW